MPLATAPESTNKLPWFLTTVPLAVPSTFMEPPLTTMATALPPDDTISKAPDSISEPLATPPESTYSEPPITTVPLATPPESSSSIPPLLTVADTSRPPEVTAAIVPSPMAMPLEAALTRSVGANISRP